MNFILCPILKNILSIVIEIQSDFHLNGNVWKMKSSNKEIVISKDHFPNIKSLNRIGLFCLFSLLIECRTLGPCNVFAGKSFPFICPKILLYWYNYKQWRVLHISISTRLVPQMHSTYDFSLVERKQSLFGFSFNFNLFILSLHICVVFENQIKWTYFNERNQLLIFCSIHLCCCQLFIDK